MKHKSGIKTTYDMIPVMVGPKYGPRHWLLDINGHEVAFIKNLKHTEGLLKEVSFEVGDTLHDDYLIWEAIESGVRGPLSIKGIDLGGTIVQENKFHNAKLCRNGSSIHLTIQFESETLLY